MRGNSWFNHSMPSPESIVRKRRERRRAESRHRSRTWRAGGVGLGVALSIAAGLLMLAGGLAYGVLKQELFELLDAAFGEARERYHHYVNDTRYIDNVLSRGAQIAHEIAAPVLQRVRDSLGVNRILLAASINL